MVFYQQGPARCISLPMLWLGVILLFNANCSFGWLSSTPTPTQTPTPTTLRFRHKSNTAHTATSPSSSIDTTTIDAPDPSKILFRSPLFGEFRKIRLSEDDEEDTFLGKMGCPTFAANNNEWGTDVVVDFVTDPTLKNKKKRRGLEGAINHGPAFIVDNILTSNACEQIISDCEYLNFGKFSSGRNLHSAMQIVVEPYMAEAISKQLAPHIDVNELETLRREMILQGRGNNDMDDELDSTRLFPVGLNRRWRIYRYDSSGNETFAPHIDAGFPPSGLTEDQNSLVWDDSSSFRNDQSEEIVSRLTVLMYLNDDFVGGETKFYSPEESQNQQQPLSHPIASVRPVAGSMLLFPQGVGEDAVEYARKFWPTHEGSSVQSGRPKYVIRSDVLFATHREKPPFDDDAKLFRYDNVVRKAFIPKPTVWDSKFLSHVDLLYSPYMGVENLGPFLYSFFRMTKSRKVVEIGAGYTTLWILQALKDNDVELETIRSIQRDDKCKLLNIDWTIHSAVEDFDSEPSKLLCIDNCEHQKETASGAGAVALALGLDSYLEFQRGDAFAMNLEKHSVDALWCDFGVGARMSEFISSAWDCIRPGGFLLCHSTITNENTRLWLEAIRSRQPKEITGINPGEYTELSLLENHKRFQNSVSIIQKRKSTDGDIFEEPIYSQYA